MAILTVIHATKRGSIQNHSAISHGGEKMAGFDDFWVSSPEMPGQGHINSSLIAVRSVLVIVWGCEVLFFPVYCLFDFCMVVVSAL